MSKVDWSRWFLDYDAAVAAAKKTRKPILLQFHRDTCAGCKKLYALTYPDPEVAAELHEWFVPLRLDIRQDREIRSRYAAVWTPSFYVLDWKGKLFFHCDGYLNAEDFRVILRLGKAAVDITRGRYEGVMSLMEDGLARFPNNPRAATLLFRRGMAMYLWAWDRDAFRDAMLDIIERYPASPEARMWPWLDDPQVELDNA